MLRISMIKILAKAALLIPSAAKPVARVYLSLRAVTYIGSFVRGEIILCRLTNPLIKEVIIEEEKL